MQFFADFILGYIRITFHFHFGDCLELCLRKSNTLKKKFQVIHCSSLVPCLIGCVNIISSCQNVLHNSESVLLTDIHLPYVQLRLNLSLIDYIESSLCYPLSLIPTLYGLKLRNHLQLGSPNPVKMHEDIEKNLFITLKWQQALGYSENIPLEISPALERAIKQLAAARFTSELQFCCGYTLYTFNYIIQSLASRCALFQPIATFQSDFFLTEVLPSDRLAWQIEQAWIKGEPVLQYSFTSVTQSHVSQAFASLSQESKFKFSLISSSLLLAPTILRVKPFQHNWIKFFQRTTGKSTITYHINDLTKDELQDSSFSFLLVQDHDPNLALLIADVANNNNSVLINLNQLKKRWFFSLQSDFICLATINNGRTESTRYDWFARNEMF